MLVLSGANTYSGQTLIEGGTLSVSSIGNVVGGVASNLGMPSNAANGVIAIGLGTFVGTLRYTGTGETSDRGIGMLSTVVVSFLDNSGTGLLKFTGNVTTGGGNHSFYLQGSTGGTGEIAGGIPDNGATKTTIIKTGTGTWVLSGANTFTGNLAVGTAGATDAGILRIGPTGTLATPTAQVLSGTLDLNGTTQSFPTALFIGGGAAGTTASVTLGGDRKSTRLNSSH